MRLHVIDWLVILLYVAFAVAVGLRFARRAGKDVDEFFLSGRRLPWWIAGTSMVATTFAADTPLVIGGWVRDHGIWKNWLWWCYAVGGMLTAFFFARYWRRGRVMTTAELAELRYGDAEARVLRGFLGVYHAGISNTMVLCWVLLAAAKIMDVLLGVDQTLAVAVACVLALSYSLLAGFWGVVLTDLVQFAMAMIGSITLAVVCWSAIGGLDGLLESEAALGPDTLSFFPATGGGSIFDGGFWTVSAAAVVVYLGVSWWAVDSVDGGGLVVQRIAATRDERHGVLAVLWYNVAHNALRPWPWILVALASLVILPTIEVQAPESGRIVAVESDFVMLRVEGEGDVISVPIENPDADDWRPIPKVALDADVKAGDVVARTDSERAYVVMMARYLPIGLLGLAVASLLAAFMSTIDTHVNLAASFFVNDVYRRFLRPEAPATHYVKAARVTCVVVMVVAAVLAANAESINDLFMFFLAFLGGVGPIYILRWFWWRVRAVTEITAMIASSVATTALTVSTYAWSEGPLTPGGELSAAGRICIVAGFSTISALVSIAVTRAPKPESLVDFYRVVRPPGAWGPVRDLAGDDLVSESSGRPLLGAVAGLVAIFGATLGIGDLLLGHELRAAFLLAAAVVGWIVVSRVLKTLVSEPEPPV